MSKKGLKLLFADDEPSLQELMRLELPGMGHEATICPDGTTALAALERNTYDCLLVDLDMPGATGLEVIHHAKQLNPKVDAIVLTGKGTLETAIEALRQGAFDYLTKPCRLAEIEKVLDRVAEKRQLTHKYLAAKKCLERLEGSSKLFGRSEPMQRVRLMISKVAPTDSTVVLLGETGTGKELAARAVHDQSRRAEMPFVAINCGALPENLIESELFGHRKGSFTGAEEHRTGLFEVAHGGTLFLDEIGEMPKAVQAKLLRFLESGEIRRIGENEPTRCDVRVVCATLRNLEAMVAEDRFREDLWFRINTFEVRLPPLRERRKDLPELIVHLARRLRSGLEVTEARQIFTPEALDLFAEHPWPGNVRQLVNVIEHALILAEGLPVGPESLPRRFVESERLAPSKTGGEAPDAAPKTLRELELDAVEKAIARNQGNKPRAAEELGISLKTLYNRINAAEQVKKSA